MNNLSNVYGFYHARYNLKKQKEEIKVYKEALNSLNKVILLHKGRRVVHIPDYLTQARKHLKDRVVSKTKSLRKMRRDLYQLYKEHNEK
jgi:hypothetical protein